MSHEGRFSKCYVTSEFSSLVFNEDFQYANKMLLKIYLFGPCVPK